MASKKSIVYCFGRFNPVSKGHQALWDFIAKQAKKIRGEGVIFPSQTQDAKKNPLHPKDKAKYIKKCISGIKGLTVSESGLNNPYAILEELIKQGYTKIQFVVGADRKNQFNPMQGYADDWGEGNVTLDIITFADERVGDYSATKMRALAQDDNFKDFYKDCPESLSEKDSLEMFNKVKEGLKV